MPSRRAALCALPVVTAVDRTTARTLYPDMDKSAPKEEPENFMRGTGVNERLPYIVSLLHLLEMCAKSRGVEPYHLLTVDLRGSSIVVVTIRCPHLRKSPVREPSTQPLRLNKRRRYLHIILGADSFTQFPNIACDRYTWPRVCATAGGIAAVSQVSQERRWSAQHRRQGVGSQWRAHVS